jgi:thioredoxin reductase (NADPH)
MQSSPSSANPEPSGVIKTPCEPPPCPTAHRDRRRHRRRRPGRPVPGVRARPAGNQGPCDRLAGLPGGQPVELYPDKPIYDIPGVPVCTGQELTDSLLKQIEPFGATFHYGPGSHRGAAQDDGRFFVQTSKGTQFSPAPCSSRPVWAPSSPARSRSTAWTSFHGTQLLLPRQEPGRLRRQEPGHRGRRRLGPGLGAELRQGQARTRPKASSWCTAATASRPHRPAWPRCANCATRTRCSSSSGQVTGFEEKDGKLTGVKVTGADGITRVVPLDMLLVFFGLSPKLGPIAEWGLDIERKQLKVDTEKFSTSVPGIFAVGDINTYPGKKKLILSGFPRMRAGRLWCGALHLPREEDPPAVHHHQPASCTRCWAWSLPSSTKLRTARKSAHR